MLKGNVMSFKPVVGAFLKLQPLPTRPKAREGAQSARSAAVVSFMVCKFGCQKNTVGWVVGEREEGGRGFLVAGNGRMSTTLGGWVASLYQFPPPLPLLFLN